MVTGYLKILIYKIKGFDGIWLPLSFLLIITSIKLLLSFHLHKNNPSKYLWSIPLITQNTNMIYSRVHEWFGYILCHLTIGTHSERYACHWAFHDHASILEYLYIKLNWNGVVVTYLDLALGEWGGDTFVMWCMCVCMGVIRMGTCVCRCTHVCMCLKARGWCWASSLIALHFICWGMVSHWTRNSLIQLSLEILSQFLKLSQWAAKPTHFSCGC